MTARTSTALRIAAIATAAAVVAGCGGGADVVTTTAGPQFPSVAVDGWLEALEQRDYDAAAKLVEPLGASIVLAVENGLGDEPLAELLESGWTDDLTVSFWSSFAEEFPLFAGSGLGDIAVGRHFALPEVDGEYAAVEIGLGSDVGLVITRQTTSGAWQVDLLATLGGAFVPLVFDRVDDLGEGAAADLVASVIRTTALDSLEAAAAAYPDDIRLETEIARIRQLVGSG